MFTWFKRTGVVLGTVAIAIPIAAGTALADPATGTVALCVTDSTGANVTLGSDQAWSQVNGGSIAYAGPVGSSGCRETTAVAGASMAVWAAVNGTASDHLTVTVPNGTTTTVNFYTTNVTIQYPGSVAFGGPVGSYRWFKHTTSTASKELLSDGVHPTMFAVDSTAGRVGSIPISWPIATGSGASASFSLMAMQVLKNDGTGEVGATARYTFEPASGGGFVPATDSRGLAGWSYPGLLSNIHVHAHVNNTTKTMTGDPATIDLFKFQTTNLTLHYNGPVRYFYGGANNHGASWFVGPSMELFAGTYPLQFESGPAAGNPGGVFTQTSITVPDPADGPMTTTAEVIRFQDSSGAGLVGSVSYYLHGWHNPGIDTNMTAHSPWTPALTGQDPGSAVILFDGAPTAPVHFALSYQGQRQQLPPRNIQTDSVAYFHTNGVTVELNASDGDPLNGAASYYAHGWHSLGALGTDGEVHAEMLPGNYWFAMSHLGTREQFTEGVGGANDNVVTFQTEDVTVELNASDGDPLNGAASYYAHGWHSLGVLGTDGEVHAQMLPGNYWFAMSHLGTHEQFTEGVGGANDNEVTFQTGTIHSDSGTATSYYASEWRPFTQDMQLLSGSYWFAFSDGTPMTQEALTGGGATNHIH